MRAGNDGAAARFDEERCAEFAAGKEGGGRSETADEREKVGTLGVRSVSGLMGGDTTVDFCGFLNGGGGGGIAFRSASSFARVERVSFGVSGSS